MGAVLLVVLSGVRGGVARGQRLGGRRLGPFARLLSVAALLLGALAFVAAVAAGRRLAAPAGRLVAAAGQVEAGDLGVRVPVRGPAELRAAWRAPSTR